MKKLPPKYKIPLLIFINILPFVLVTSLYRYAIYLLALPFFLILTYINYYACEKALPYALLQTYIVACLICSGYVSVYLYYHNISSDPMTPAIGLLSLILETVPAVITTVITVIVKAKNNKHGTTAGEDFSLFKNF